ncbi:unnamed protein product [Rhizophagus irregularis]|nr:unnamed protein product [Rhizophagus irregularis]
MLSDGLDFRRVCAFLVLVGRFHPSASGLLQILFQTAFGFLRTLFFSRLKTGCITPANKYYFSTIFNLSLWIPDSGIDDPHVLNFD